MMTGRKWIAAALSAALLAGLTACGGGAPVNQTPEEAEAPAISEAEEAETTETGDVYCKGRLRTTPKYNMAAGHL